jgi:PAS domain S-box-containing protein
VTYIDALEGVSTTLYISPQAEQLTGYTDREWLDDQDLWERIIHPEDRAWVLAENKHTQVAGEPFRAEYRIVRRDGAVRWVQDQADLVEENGRPVFWRGFMADVTDRREAQSALADAEVRYRALVENIPAMTYIEAVEDARMLYISPQIERLSGYAPKERIEDSGLWEQIVHPDDRAAFVEANARAERTGEPFALEYRIVARDGHVVWLHDEAVLVRDAAGTPLFWQGATFDVTQRVVSEQERERLLSHLVSAQEEERSRIAVRVHDGPIQKMTAVDLRLQMLRPELGDAGRELLDGLHATVREAIEGMRTLLVELRPPQLDREGLATALVQYLSHPSTGRTVRFSIDDRLGAEPPPALRSIAYRIAQEAIANVWKHAEAGHVHVELVHERGTLSLAITDDGVGFDPSELGPVAGHIGMETMRERAEMAGGTLEVDSEPGRGTTVRFRLPWD